MSKYFLTFFKKYFFVTLLCTVIIFSTTVQGDELKDEKDLRNTVKIKDEKNVDFVKTEANDIFELFKEQEIILNTHDKVNHDIFTKVTDGLSIEINRANKIRFIINGGKDTLNFEAPDVNIGKAILLVKEELDRTFKLEEGQSSAFDLKDGLEIRVTEVEEEFDNIITEIPFETKVVENDYLELGKEVVKTEGVNGKKETNYKSVYLKGKLVKSFETSSKITVEPINKVIEKGTGKKVNEIKAIENSPSSSNVVNTEEGSLEYTKVINAKSTAYTASSTGKKASSPGYGVTASGMKARVGVVAVDTKVIPLGTKLYIEGYGVAVAGDTGGAIKGNKVDVYFDTYEEAIKYGVKNVKVYILK